MTGAQNPYSRVANTLQYCLDATLQTMCRQKGAQISTHISAPVFLACVYMSYAVQFLQARTTMSMTSATAPSVLASITLSAHISDLVQAALDAVAAQASANRVELIIISASTFLLTTTRSDGTHAPRFVDSTEVDDIPWYPSSSYPIAALSMLIHIFSCLVHNAAQDSCIIAHPQQTPQANRMRMSMYFDATIPVQEATWPPWLGPFVDLQSALSDFGFHLSQLPLTQDDIEQNAALHALKHAKYPTCLRITLSRPSGSDLLTSETADDRDAPMIAPGLTAMAALPVIQSRRVYIPSPDASAYRQLRECLDDWQCTLVAKHERPDMAIVWNDAHQLESLIKARIPCIFISSLPRIAALLADPLPRSIIPLTEPVSRSRLALGFYSLLCKDGKRTELSALSPIHRSAAAAVDEAGIQSVSLQVMANHLAQRTSRQQQQQQQQDQQSHTASTSAPPGPTCEHPPSPKTSSLPIVMPAMSNSSQAASGTAEVSSSAAALVKVPSPCAQDSILMTPSAADLSDVSSSSSDYFTQAFSRLASQANMAGGRLVHGADGRPAGLYFQPRESPSLKQSSRPGTGTASASETQQPPHMRHGDSSAQTASMPSYPTASMLRAAQSHMPRIKDGLASGFHASPMPTTLSFSQRDSVSRPNAPTSIRLPPHNFDPKAQPSRPTPYAHLPSRSVRTFAKPQEGMVIGKRDELRHADGKTPPQQATSPLLSPAPYSPLLSPQSMTRLQWRKIAMREEFLPPVNVLVVEDNTVNQRILATFLQRKNILYEVARDGREAVEKWRRGNFHLILMDIQLPVMDGIAATKEIRRLESLARQSGPTEHVQDMPMHNARHSVIIVALTASVHTKDRVEALAAGCNDFLNKPVNLPWLQRKILEWGSMQYLLHAGMTPAPPAVDMPDRPNMRAAAPNFHVQANKKASTIARRLHIPALLPPTMDGAEEDAEYDNDTEFSLPNQAPVE